MMFRVDRLLHFLKTALETHHRNGNIRDDETGSLTLFLRRYKKTKTTKFIRKQKALPDSLKEGDMKHMAKKNFHGGLGC